MFGNRLCTCLAISLLSCLPAVARAQLLAPAAVPASPPLILLFEAFDENLATLTMSQTVETFATATLTRINAAGAAETVEVKVPELRQQNYKYLLAETKIRTVGGRELDRKEAASQLKKGQPVILLSVSNKLPEAYKSLFRDEAIILEVKALGMIPDLDGVKPAKP
jgi:hypothetical protein